MCYGQATYHLDVELVAAGSGSSSSTPPPPKPIHPRSVRGPGPGVHFETDSFILYLGDCLDVLPEVSAGSVDMIGEYL